MVQNVSLADVSAVKKSQPIFPLKPLSKKVTKVQKEISRWLVVGSGDTAVMLERENRTYKPKAELIFLTDDKKTYSSPAGKSSDSLFDNIDNLDALSRKSCAGILVDDSIDKLSDDTATQLMKLRLEGVSVYTLIDFHEQLCKKIPPSFLKADWFAYSFRSGLVNNPINSLLKRLLDLCVASGLLLVTSPLLGLAALAVKLESAGPIIYSQERTGLRGKPFKIHKVRSMRQDAESQGAQWAQTQDPRITRVGQFLRKTRIDELPQLWNVIKGEMTLIGPRPERPQFDQSLRQDIPYYDVRYIVKPGITGWAQVNYPYGASTEDAYHKLAYDIYYIKNYSLWLDVLTAFKTIGVVLHRQGR